MNLLKAIQKNDALKILVVIFAFFILGTGIVMVRKPAPPALPAEAPQQFVAAPVANVQSSIIYGVWEGNKSVIRQVNVDGTGHTDLGSLPFAIKNISRLSDGQFVYIADTDSKDHGKRIEIRDLSASSGQTVVEATPGWGIDSLVVSRDGAWIAYWEVKLGSKGQLLGGNSRLYSAALSTLPAQRYTVFDEAATDGSIVHYPLFFDAQGNLYADGFAPNGSGWNQELVKTSARPAVPNQYSVMLPKGMYNSDPVLAPSGRSFAFTGYDAASGSPMTQNVGSSSKATVATMNPNTVYMMDTDTNAKRVLHTEAGRLFYDLTWKTDGSALFVRSYSVVNDQLADAKALVIDLTVPTVPSVTTMDTSVMTDGFILSFGPDGVITGVGHASGATGNLGSTYAPVLSEVALANGTSNTSFSAQNGQFITSINSVVDPSKVNLVNTQTSGDSLKLATFALKPELEQRPIQQNEVDLEIKDGKPRCRRVYEMIYGGTRYLVQDTVPETLDPNKADLQTTTGQDPSLQIAKFGPGIGVKAVTGAVPKFGDVKPQLKAEYKCYDSPLYLYPQEPTRVNVTVTNADILSTNMPYTADAGWNLMADPKGTKIDYAYGASFTAPETGMIVAKADLAATLTDYGARVGLNQKELSDYVSFWTTEVLAQRSLGEVGPQADYYLVSHFSNPSQIMNFVITPQPDVMIQTIMYFKPLTTEQAAAYSNLAAPQFTPVPERSGFTAVDWSGIIDR